MDKQLILEFLKGQQQYFAFDSIAMSEHRFSEFLKDLIEVIEAAPLNTTDITKGA